MFQIKTIKEWIFREEVLFFLGYILITFLNAWDFRDRVVERPLFFILRDLANPEIYDFSALEKMRIVLYPFINQYWILYCFSVCMAISFFYVANKLNIKKSLMYITLLTLPVIRFGVSDYGDTELSSIVYLIMIWTYYFGKDNNSAKTHNRIPYIILSFIGIFTREFCIYINLFFIIEKYISDYKFKELFKNLFQRTKRVLMENWFDLLIIGLYVVYRMIFSIVFDINAQILYWGMLQWDLWVYSFSNLKVLIVFIFIFGIQWLFLIFKPNQKMYIFLFCIFIPTFIFGFIWQINKLGCIWMLIAFQLYPKNPNNLENSIKNS